MTTITLPRAVVEQALEALEAMQSYAAAERKGLRICDEAIPALRAALEQQAEPVEPVAWNWMLDGLPYGRACYGDPPDADIAERAATAGRTVRLLYTAPPQRKPLTDATLWGMWVDSPSDVLRFARAVERAHGIKE